jgi:hypothetical protein
MKTKLVGALFLVLSACSSQKVKEKVMLKHSNAQLLSTTYNGPEIYSIHYGHGQVAIIALPPEKRHMLEEMEQRVKELPKQTLEHMADAWELMNYEKKVFEKKYGLRLHQLDIGLWGVDMPVYRREKNTFSGKFKGNKRLGVLKEIGDASFFLGKNSAGWYDVGDFQNAFREDKELQKEYFHSLERNANHQGYRPKDEHNYLELFIQQDQ